jgi:hypothetical protein
MTWPVHHFFPDKMIPYSRGSTMQFNFLTTLAMRGPPLFLHIPLMSGLQVNSTTTDSLLEADSEVVHSDVLLEDAIANLLSNN